jgi:hypothetical protein
MNRPAILPVGKETWRWIKAGGTPTRINLGRRLSYAWISRCFEVNRSLQARLPLLVPQTMLDPVFVMGLWRSGTTYLHELICASPEFQCTATWQCMNPASFRLGSKPPAGLTVARPMDDMVLDAHSPQEDEFALLSLGVPSVYRGFLDPRRLQELSQWMEPDSWRTDTPHGWTSVWQSFLAGVTDGRSERLILKSPSHSFRIQPIAELYPQATCIWIVRDPTEIFLSNRKMWRAMFERYALWDWDEAELDTFLCRAFRAAASCLERALALLPRQRFAVVDFDRLVSQPVLTLESLNCQLNLGVWERMKRSIGLLAESRAGHRSQLYAISDLTREVREAIEHLNGVQKIALSARGLYGLSS